MNNLAMLKALLISSFVFLSLASCSNREALENEMLRSRIKQLEDENLTLKVQLAQLEAKYNVRSNESQNLRDIQAAAESLNWKGPADVAASARETAVRKNMETVQVIAEVYAQEHQGTYPTMEVLLTRLPRGMVNPFTESGNLGDVVVAGLPGRPGVTGYDLSLNASGRGVGYRIRGFGAEGLLTTVLKGGRS
jgi:hypothetical protein